MAIDLFGHTSYPVGEAQRRLDYIQRSHPEWFDAAILLGPANNLGRFGGELAREFGIEAQSHFGIFMNHKDRLELLTPAVEFIYEVFGTERLVVSWGMDSVRAAERTYPGVAI